LSSGGLKEDKALKFARIVLQYKSLFSEKPGFLTICVATAISFLGVAIVMPILPIFTKEFGVGAAAIGLVVGIYGMARLFLNLPAGLLSQRFGRRVMMGGGLMLCAVGTGFMGFAGEVNELVLWRFLSGAGSAMYMTGAMSFITDISTDQNRGRLMSLHQGCLLIGVDSGPILGGFIADSLGYRWAFYLAGLLTLAAAIWVLLSLPKTRSRSRDEFSQKDTSSSPGSFWDIHTIKALLTNQTFLIVNLFSLMVFFTRTGSRHTLLPLLASGTVGMSATQLGLLFTVMATINFLFVFPAGVLTDRYGRKSVVLPGVALTVLALSLFAFSESLWAFFMAGVILGAGTGIIGPTPTAYIGDLAPHGKAGIAMGLHRTFGDLGFITGPIVLGIIADATEDKFAGITGVGISMEFNVILLLIVAFVLVKVARETSGFKSRPITFQTP